MGNTFKTIVVGFFAGLLGAYVLFQFQKSTPSPDLAQPQYQAADFRSNEAFNQSSVSTGPSSFPAENVDFSTAAAKAIPNVVYINSISQSGPTYSYWDMLFNGGGQQTQVSSGSGVIFTSDGYIVTNNHVVESAEKIQVIYNKKIYDAELIGTDPSTDLGVLKIKETIFRPPLLGIQGRSRSANGSSPSGTRSRFPLPLRRGSSVPKEGASTSLKTSFPLSPSFRRMQRSIPATAEVHW